MCKIFFFIALFCVYSSVAQSDYGVSPKKDYYVNPNCAKCSKHAGTYFLLADTITAPYTHGAIVTLDKACNVLFIFQQNVTVMNTTMTNSTNTTMMNTTMTPMTTEIVATGSYCCNSEYEISVRAIDFISMNGTTYVMDISGTLDFAYNTLVARLSRSECSPFVFLPYGCPDVGNIQPYTFNMGSVVRPDSYKSQLSYSGESSYGQYYPQQQQSYPQQSYPQQSYPQQSYPQPLYPQMMQTYAQPMVQVYPQQMQTYQPPAQQTYQPPAQQTYQPPAQQTYQPPAQQTYQMPQQPAQQTYQPPAQQTYQMPQQPAQQTYQMPQQPTQQTYQMPQQTYQQTQPMMSWP